MLQYEAIYEKSSVVKLYDKLCGQQMTKVSKSFFFFFLLQNYYQLLKQIKIPIT